MEESEGFSLIDDVSSSENFDSLIATADASTETQDETRRFELTGDLGASNTDNMALTNGQSEQLPQLLESSEPERLRKTGKCNLRKSLAWDRAFFESPGVLDAEELSSMIEGADKGKKQFLPGIEEDICRSTESISTLVSENLTLETLEADLFEDIRASIQKSSKASNMTNSNRMVAQAEKDNQVNSSAKKADLTSRNRITTNAASKKQTMGMQGSGRMIKQGSSYTQVTQPVLRNGNSTSSLPQPPKVISRATTTSTITTKRASLGANHVKAEIDNAKVGGKGIQVPKATGLAGPRRTVPKPALSSKSSSPASFGATKEAAGTSSSSDGSNSTLSDKIRKSPLISGRRKTETRSLMQPSSGSIPKASVQVPLRKKPSPKSGVSTSLTSSKISSSISPASSISEWSSASSSTSTVNQKFKPRTSIDTSSSCRSLDTDTRTVVCLDVQSNDQISDGVVNQVTEFPSQDIKKTSMQTGVLSRSALMKPSGLRMPSPKIGFFDGAKSAARTPNGCRQSQSHLPTGLPKIGAGICSPVGSSKKAGDGKLPPGIKATAGAKTTLDTSKPVSPKPFQESSRASKNVSGALRGVKSPSISSEVHDDTSSISCGSQVGRSTNKAIGKFRPGMTVTSTKTKIESRKSASPKQFQEARSASPGLFSEVHNETDRVSCLKAEEVGCLRAENVGVGKLDGAEHTTFHAPEAEKNENVGDLKSNIDLLVQDSQKSGSSKPFQEALSASPGLASEVHNETDGASCLKAEEVAIGKPNKAEHTTVHASVAEKNESLGDSNNIDLLVQESQKSASPKSIHEALSAFPGLASQVHNETDGVSCLKAEDVGIGKPDRAAHCTVHAPEAEKNENLVDLKNNIDFLVQGNADAEDIKIAPTNLDMCDVSMEKHTEYRKPSQGVGEDEINGEIHCNDGLLGTINVKQIVHPADLADGISRNVEAVKIQVEMQKELTDSINSQFEVGYSDCDALELSSKKQLPDQKEVSVGDLPSSTKTSNLPSSTRIPLTAKNSLCNIEGFEFSIGSEVAEKTNILHSSDIVHNENC